MSRTDPTLRHSGAQGEEKWRDLSTAVPGDVSAYLGNPAGWAVCGGVLSIMGIHHTMSPGSAEEQCWDEVILQLPKCQCTGTSW